MDEKRKLIADRAADKWVGQRGMPCARCGGRLAYVNCMGGVSCRKCEYPAKPEYVRLPLVLISVDSINYWADGRKETKLQKWSEQVGVSIDKLRSLNKLPVEFLSVGELIWPPPYSTEVGK